MLPGDAAAEFLLDLLGLGMRAAQADGDVVGQVVAAERQHEGVLDVLAREHGQVGGPAAQVEQGRAELLLFLGEHGLAGGQALQHDVADVQARAVGALHQVVGGGHRAGHDVDLGLQPHAGHPDRVLDARLVVDDVLLGQHVDHLAVHRDRDRPGRVDHPLHVQRGDLGALDGHDAAAVETGDVAAGDPGVHR